MKSTPFLMNETRYSPFIPLMAVFVTLIVLQIIYIAGDMDERSRMQAARAEVNVVLRSAQELTATVESIGKELLALSAGQSAGARTIVAEFNIRESSPIGRVAE
jgi:hypothetical protein